MIRTFKRVPFQQGWVTAEKLDIKAIYRRPRFERGEFDEIVRVSVNGIPAWDLTTPLPVRRHTDWLAKGFEYVTLADRDSLGQAVKSLRSAGLDPAEYDQHPEFGPWNYKLFMATSHEADKTAYDELAVLVDELGSDVVLAVRRTAEPAFELPEKLRGIVPRAQRKLDPAKKSTPQPGTIEDYGGYEQAIAEGRIAPKPTPKPARAKPATPKPTPKPEPSTV